MKAGHLRAALMVDLLGRPYHEVKAIAESSRLLDGC